MATELGELGDFLDPGLALKINGKRYVVPLPSAEVGLWCQLTIEAAGTIKASDSKEEIAAAVARVNAMPQSKDKVTLAQRLLGPVHAEMLADQAPHHLVQFAGEIAWVWIIGGEEAAERYYRAGGRPEAMRPTNRQERRAAPKKAAGGSRTGAGAKTPSAASGSGTRSRTTSAAAKKAAPKKRA